MTFTSDTLRQLASALAPAMPKVTARLSATFRRRQPDFCQMIAEVGLDPRCVRAHAFCVAFCEVALEYAEHCTGRRLPKYSAATVREVVCRIAQRQAALIGGRATRYPTRIRRYVLDVMDFDEDDARWLCTTLSAFLVMLEGSLGRRHRPPPADRSTSNASAGTPRACGRRRSHAPHPTGSRSRPGPTPASHPKSSP